MSLGAIGNTIYVNQQTASVSGSHGNENNKLDLQNVIAQDISKDKENNKIEVRPTEENKEINKDSENNKKEKEEKKKDIKLEDEDTSETNNDLHILDVRV